MIYCDHIRIHCSVKLIIYNSQLEITQRFDREKSVFGAKLTIHRSFIFNSIVYTKMWLVTSKNCTTHVLSNNIL